MDGTKDQVTTNRTARALLAWIVGDDDLVASLPDNYPLARSGVNSGDLVRLMLMLEEQLDRPLALEEVHNLATIADVDALLATHDRHSSQASGGAPPCG